jgi:hypothetical protein
MASRSSEIPVASPSGADKTFHEQLKMALAGLQGLMLLWGHPRRDSRSVALAAGITWRLSRPQERQGASAFQGRQRTSYPQKTVG